MKNYILNRWGAKIAINQPVTMAHPRGGFTDGTITAIDTTSEFSRAYGPRITLDNGTTGTADDCRIGLGKAHP